MPARNQPRRTQEERSAATRTALLEATVGCLAELGYAGTTTTEIAARAGLSRGAQLHHFPSKAELVSTAVEHLAHRQHDEFVEAFARRPPAADRAAAAIDLLWPLLSGPTFYAWLELVVAARTDAELRERMAVHTERFMDRVAQTFREIFPEAETDAFFSHAPRFVFALMNGMAVYKILDVGSQENLLETLKSLARLIQPGTPH